MVTSKSFCFSFVCFFLKDSGSSFGPGHAKMCLMPYANNKVSDQPAHLHSLISTFVIRCLDGIISVVST